MGYGFYPFRKDKVLSKYINQLGYFYTDIRWNVFKPYGNILFWSVVTGLVYTAATNEHSRKIPMFPVLERKREVFDTPIDLPQPQQ